MKNKSYAYPNPRKKASARSMRLALENRLLFDGAVVATAAQVMDDKAGQDQAHDASADAKADVAPPDAIIVLANNLDSQSGLIDTKDFAPQPQAITAAASSGNPDAPTLLVIDPRAEGSSELLKNPPPKTDVRILDESRDGYQQIADILQERGKTTELHLLTSDANGQQWLGSSQINSSLSTTNSAALTDWGDDLASNANIVVHSRAAMNSPWLNHVNALTGGQTSWTQDYQFDSNNTAAKDAVTKTQAKDSDDTADAVATAPTAHPTALVFIDTSVADYQTLLDGIDPDATVVLLDPSKDGVEQIAQSVSKYNDIQAIHVISHGDAGKLYLGTGTLDNANMQGQYADELAIIGQHLSQDADILVYGCNFGQGAIGESATLKLATLTGADVAASTDDTGAASLGGDWQLELQTGEIEAGIVTSSASQVGYRFVLAPTPTTLNFSGTPTKTIEAAGLIGDQWRYTGVTSGVDALVTITAVSGNPTLVNIDAPASGGGRDSAFQPVISSIPSTNENIQFTVTFVQSGTSTATTVNNIVANGIDVDGGPNGTEFASWVGASGVRLEAGTQITQLTGTPNPSFKGVPSSFAGIDLEQTVANYTVFYDGQVSSLTFRLGSIGTQTSVIASRQNSISFDALDIQAYNVPVAASDSATTSEENPVTFSILDNDWGGEQGTNGAPRAQTPFDLSSVDLDPSTAGIQTTRTVTGQGTFTYNGNGTVTFTPVANFNGDVTPIQYTVNNTVVAGLNPTAETSNASTIRVNVSPVNDAPVNTVPAAQLTPEDTTKVFSTVNGNAIQISDVDAGNGNVTVTLWAEHGSITLANTAGLTFSTTTNNTVVSDGTNDETIRITGTVANINAALNGLSFKPTANNSGAGKITIRTEDNVNSPGANLTDTDSVVIDFAPVKDTLLDSVITNEDTAIVISPLTNDLFGAGNGFLTGITAPANGTAVLNANGTTTYTPNANFNGTDTYKYTVTTIDPGFNYEYWVDNQPNGNTYPSVFPSGFPTTPPNATGWTAGISELDGIRIQEHQNDTDNALTARWSGVVLIEQAGSYTFSLSADNAARLLIDGNPIVTVGYSQGVLTATLALTAGVHNFQLQYADVENPQNVNLSYSGLDTGGSTINVNNDKHWGSAVRTETETINVTINPVIDPPIATPISRSGSEDNPVSVNLAGTDADGTVSTVTVTALPPATQGILYLVDGTTPVAANTPLTPTAAAGLIFKPAPDFNGAVTVPFTVTDNEGSVSAPANANITITPVNDPPIAVSGSTNTLEDTDAPVNLTGTDIDGTVSTVTVTALPPATQGILTKADGSPVVAGVPLTPTEAAGLIFNPAPNFNGIVTIPFTVVDNNGATSAPGSFVIDVKEVDDEPIANPDTVNGSEDTPVPVKLTGTDVEGPIKAVTVTTLPPTSQGILTKANGTPVLAGVPLSPAEATGLVFTPALNFSGTVVISFTVTDSVGQVSSPPADLTINIVEVNDPPIASPISSSGNEDTPIPINLAGTDIDGTVNAVTVTTLPPATQGILYLPDGKTPVIAGVPLSPVDAAGLVFKPAPNFNGTVAIPFTVTDNDGAVSAPANANITVAPVNDPPVAVSGSVNTLEDTDAPVDLIGTDVDGTINTVTVTALPNLAQGILYLADGVTPVVAGTPLIPAEAAGLIFRPAPNTTGIVGIEFTVSDNNGATSTLGNFVIDVANVDDDPVATPTTVTGTEDTPVPVKLTGTDIEGPIASVTVTALPPASQGILAKADGSPVVAGVPLTPAEAAGLVFNPAPNFSGTVAIPFTVTDSSGQVSSSPADLTINIAEVNDPPIANDDGPIATKPNTPAQGNVLTGSGGATADVDAEGNPLSVTQFTIPSVGTFTAGSTATIPSVGTLVINKDGSFTFTPGTGYDGSVPTTTYTITDGISTDTAILSFAPVPNTPPMANNDGPVATLADDPVRGNVLGNDTDPDSDPLTVTQFAIAGVPGVFAAGTTATIPGVGILVINANGRFVFDPRPGYAGPVPRATYTVSDGTGTDAAILTFADVPKGSNIGALIMLANPTPPLFPPSAGGGYSLLPFREPGLTWNGYETYSPSLLGLYGTLQDYDLYLTGSLRNQVVLEMQTYSFSVPPGTFRHTNPNEQLEYEASRIDGSPLPNWLHFNPKQLKFSGVPPKGAMNTEVMVKARDRYGNEAYATFKVTVNKERDYTHKGRLKFNSEHHTQVDGSINQHAMAAGKLAFNEQLNSSGKLSRLMESRALLDSLSHL
jgi:CshA-type fibril repeat protein